MDTRNTRLVVCENCEDEVPSSEMVRFDGRDMCTYCADMKDIMAKKSSNTKKPNLPSKSMYEDHKASPKLHKKDRKKIRKQMIKHGD